jgi:hypothetical protein
VSRLVDLLGIYARVFRRGIELGVRHWWLGPVFAAYQLALFIAMIFAAPFGILGGFLVAIAFAALASSGLVLLGYVVRQGRATLADVSGSFGVYLGDVMTVGFLLWVMGYVAGAVFPNGSDPARVFWLAVWVVLNVVFEEIYLAGESGPAVFVGSYQFVATHWIEWFPAAVVLYVIWTIASNAPLGLFAEVVGGFALAFMAVCRGLLFLELTTSSRRAREFQRRATG